MNTRSGRRSGSPDTRAQILDAARELFGERGYDRTSVRAVAGAAGVDAALVHHYFGTKDKLFLAMFDAPVDPRSVLAQVVSAGPDAVGETLIRTFLTLWESPHGAALVGLLRSAVADPERAALLKDFLVLHVLVPTLAGLGVPEPEIPRRAGLLASQLAGLALTRYVLRLDPLVEADHDELAAAVGPTLQRYVTGVLG